LLGALAQGASPAFAGSHDLPASEKCECPLRSLGEGGPELRRVTPYRKCHELLSVGLHFWEGMRRGQVTMIGKKIDAIRLGDKAEFAKTISESDVYLYAGVTGDLNPAHVNEEYAKKTFFKTRIAHGMLSAGFISTIFGTKFPGPGTIYLRQVIEFVAPVYIGDTITASVEVVDINVEKNRVIFKTICVNQVGKEVLTGEAVVSPPKALKK
jgi:3-hydroxybutyryl-CoA dehydratase